MPFDSPSQRFQQALYGGQVIIGRVQTVLSAFAEGLPPQAPRRGARVPARWSTPAERRGQCRCWAAALNRKAVRPGTRRPPEGRRGGFSREDTRWRDRARQCVLHRPPREMPWRYRTWSGKGFATPCNLPVMISVWKPRPVPPGFWFFTSIFCHAVGVILRFCGS